MIPASARMFGSRQLAAAILFFSFAAASGLHAQVTNASFSGTYTYQFGSQSGFTVLFNMFNQQVGFCPPGVSNPKIPAGYYCYFSPTASDLTTGTLVVDGKGNVITGSTFTDTFDPQEYECAKVYNPVGTCPVTVPSNNVWSSSTAYVIGNVVDYTVGGKVLTYQAVENSTNVAPSSSACTATVKPPKCDWDQVLQSTSSGVPATKTGTFTGTYSLQSNGSGVMQVTPSGATTASSFSILVQPVPLAVGQMVALQGLPAINNENSARGTGVRVK